MNNMMRITSTHVYLTVRPKKGISRRLRLANANTSSARSPSNTVRSGTYVSFAPRPGFDRCW
jgi:hypothetical protein